MVLAESTGEYLKSKGYRVSIAHRDLSLAQTVTCAAEEQRGSAAADAAAGEAADSEQAPSGDIR